VVVVRAVEFNFHAEPLYVHVLPPNAYTSFRAGLHGKFSVVAILLLPYCWIAANYRYRLFIKI
jgi:hypothetical protein